MPDPQSSACTAAATFLCPLPSKGKGPYPQLVEAQNHIDEKSVPEGEQRRNDRIQNFAGFKERQTHSGLGSPCDDAAGAERIRIGQGEVKEKALKIRED